MNILDAIKERHSVRSYIDTPIAPEVVSKLQDEIDACNKEGDLHIQLVTNEPKAFTGLLAHYGKFTGVQNYIALIGKPSNDLQEKVGYYGERIVLLAQSLGLNSCWVAMTFSKGTTKKHCTFNKGEKLALVISLGIGENQGFARKSKSIQDVCKTETNLPEWFKSGVEAALLAPTAVNQQKFEFSLNGTEVELKATGGFYAQVDLGIVKYHFEIGAGKENFTWK